MPLDHGFFLHFFSFVLELFFFLSLHDRDGFCLFHTTHHSARTRKHLVFVAVAGVHNKGMAPTTRGGWRHSFRLLLRPCGIPYSTTQALTLLGGND